MRLADAGRAAVLNRMLQEEDRRQLVARVGVIDQKLASIALRQGHQARLPLKVGHPEPRQAGLRLVIAGPDEAGMQQALAERARQLGVAEAIVWTGMLRGDEKYDALHAAEVFLLPSHQENFGIAVAEALSCGVPALISNKVNIWREVVESQAGLADDDTLAGTMRLLHSWLALNASRRSAMRLNALACFRTHFHIDAAVHSLVELIGSGRAAAPSPASA